MSNYRTVFPRKNTLIAVVHVENLAQAKRNAAIALNEGADGIFLINHDVEALDLIFSYEEIRALYPTLWIGLNFLDLGRSEALGVLPPDASGLWVDNAGIFETVVYIETAEAEYFSERKKLSQKPFLYFGGVAFKYQALVTDFAAMARASIPFMDVVTTSGEATGKAADIQKIKIMKKALGEHPLAVASGITSENVRTFMPHVDCFLVATGISDSHTELNPARVRELATIVHS